MKKEKIKKLRLKKEIKIYIIYLLLMVLISYIVDFKYIYNYIAFMCLYSANLLYIITLIIDKKRK